MENQETQKKETAENKSVKIPYVGSGIRSVKGKIALQEEIINQVPFYYLDINLTDVREHDIDYLIFRLKELKKELSDKDIITCSHLSDYNR